MNLRHLIIRICLALVICSVGGLYAWRRHHRPAKQPSFTDRDVAEEMAARVAELERKVAQQAMEIDFLKRALQHVEEQRLLQELPNGARSTNRWKKK